MFRLHICKDHFDIRTVAVILEPSVSSVEIGGQSAKVLFDLYKQKSVIRIGRKKAILSEVLKQV